jgi:hypothetical protein
LENYKSDTGAFPKLAEITVAPDSIKFGSTVIALDGYLSAADISSDSGTAYCIKYGKKSALALGFEEEDGTMISFSNDSDVTKCRVSDILMPAEAPTPVPQVSIKPTDTVNPTPTI